MILTGDCRTVLAPYAPFDMILADPPYGDTSLPWDKRVDGWEAAALAWLKPTGSMWVFGSMRFFMAMGKRFEAAGWRYAQDVVWEKHNGSGFAADRFKRVHEHVVQFYRADVRWSEVWNEVQTTPDATARSVRKRAGKSAHLGSIGAALYETQEGDPRLMRSVIPVHSCHGHAIHPTEKPVGLLDVLIRTSCPPHGVVADLFAGSGAAGEAAGAAGRAYVGAEIDPDMAERARQRLASNLFSRMVVA
jgi:site-specific DNA-methyltransferase (adenine-specific)